MRMTGVKDLWEEGGKRWENKEANKVKEKKETMLEKEAAPLSLGIIFILDETGVCILPQTYS